MTHVDSGRLQSWLDGELSENDRAAAEAHLAVCTECASERDSLREAAMEVGEALGLLSPVIPLLAARARIDDSVAAARTRHTLAWPRRLVTASLLRAAAVVLLLAGAVSAAIPGSPVSSWARDLLDRASRLLGGPTSDQTAAPPVIEPTSPRAPAPERGASVGLENGRVRVVIHPPAEGTRVEVRLVDAEEATVTPLGTGTEYRLRTGAGRLELFGIDAAGVLVELPRGARLAEVEVGGRIYYSKEGDTERTPGPVRERAAGSVVFQAPPRS
jgi:hypothetical protein